MTRITVPTRAFTTTTARPDGETLNVTMTYDAANPLEVCLRFKADSKIGVEWVFSRDLLHFGMTAPTGDGDVRVGPAGRHVVVEMSSPDGRGWSHLPAAVVAGFLDQSFLLVPRDAESDALGIDRELRQLLGGGGP